MADLQLFEGGERLDSEGRHTPLNAQGVAIILELHGLITGAGTGELREFARVIFQAPFANKKGLMEEIGRVVGKGDPIPSRILAEAEKYRPFVRQHLRRFYRESLAKLEKEESR